MFMRFYNKAKSVVTMGGSQSLSALEGDKNVLIFINNNTTHKSTLLQKLKEHATEISISEDGKLNLLPKVQTDPQTKSCQEILSEFLVDFLSFKEDIKQAYVNEVKLKLQQVPSITASFEKQTVTVTGLKDDVRKAISLIRKLQQPLPSGSTSVTQTPTVAHSLPVQMLSVTVPPHSSQISGDEEPATVTTPESQSGVCSDSDLYRPHTPKTPSDAGSENSNLASDVSDSASTSRRNRFAVTDEHCIASSQSEYVVIAPEQTIARFIRFSVRHYKGLEDHVRVYATIVIRRDKEINKWVYSYRNKRHVLYSPGYDFPNFCKTQLNNFLEKFSFQSRRFNEQRLENARQKNPDFFEDRTNDQNHQLFVKWYFESNRVNVCGLVEDVEARIQATVDYLDQLVPRTFPHHFSAEIPDQHVGSFLLESPKHNMIVKQRRNLCRMSVGKSSRSEMLCMHFNTVTQITQLEKAPFESRCKDFMETFLAKYDSCELDYSPEIRDLGQNLLFNSNADLKVKVQGKILLVGVKQAVENKQKEIQTKIDELQNRVSNIPPARAAFTDLSRVEGNATNFVYICNPKERQILKFILDTNWKALYMTSIHLGRIFIDPRQGKILLRLHVVYPNVFQQCGKKLKNLFMEYNIRQMKEDPKLLRTVKRENPSYFTKQATPGCKVFADIDRDEVYVIGEKEEVEKNMKLIQDFIMSLKKPSQSVPSITTVIKETYPADTRKIFLSCGIVDIIKTQFGNESISCSIEDEKLEIKGTDKTVKEIQTQIQAMEEKLTHGPPRIEDIKLKYLQEVLCSNNPNAMNTLTEINKHLQENNIIGLLLCEHDLSLVTNGEKVFSDASKLLELFVKLENVSVPYMLADMFLSADWKELVKRHPNTYIRVQDETVCVVGIHEACIQTAVKEVKQFHADNKQKQIQCPCESEIAEFCIKRCAVAWPPMVTTNVTSSFCELVGPHKQVLEAEKMFLAVVDKYRSYVLSIQEPGFDNYTTTDEWSKFVASVEEQKCCKISVQTLEPAKLQFPKTLSAIHTNLSNECFYGKVKVQVCEGDITADDSDVIINGCKSDFNLDWGTASRAIYQRAGPIIQEQCSSRPIQQSANIRVTNEGNLLCDHVIHVVTPHLLDEMPERIKEALNFAELMKASSVAVPTLGAGGIGFTVEQVCNAFTEAIEMFADEKPVMVKTIKIVVYEPSIVSSFRENIIHTTTLSQFADVAFQAATEDLKTIVRPMKLSVCCGNDGEFNEVKQLVQDHIKSQMSKETVDYEEFQEFTLDEWIDIYLHALKCHVMLYQESLDKLTLHGFTENVNKVKSFVKEVVLDFQQSMLLYGKACLWKWSLNNMKFRKLPPRVGKSLEMAFKKRETDFFTTLLGFKLEVNTVSKMFVYQSFKGYLKQCDNDTEEIPPNWDDMNGMTLRKIEIGSSSLEYKKVVNQFKASNPHHTHIIKIERIQNPTLYQQYNIKKKEVERHLTSTNPVERELFHGTTELIAEKMCGKGFNRSFCGKNATVYGKGVYFALNSKFSSDYSDQIGTKCMFLAKVLTGDFHLGNESLLEPPVKSGAAFSSQLYDSVANDMTNPYIFVVFNDTSAYPLYLITFK